MTTREDDPAMPTAEELIRKRDDLMVETNNSRMLALQEGIAAHLDKIASMFKPGVQVTCLVRSSAFPDGSRDVIVTSDDLGEVMKAMEIQVQAAALNATPDGGQK